MGMVASFLGQHVQVDGLHVGDKKVSGVAASFPFVICLEITLAFVAGIYLVGAVIFNADIIDGPRFIIAAMDTI